jgi:hypothetical protein
MEIFDEKNEQNITEYILMNKNTPVLRFLYDDGKHKDGPIQITDILNAEYAPLGVRAGGQINSDNLSNWWKKRLIPVSRELLRHSTDMLIGMPSGEIEMDVIYELAKENHWLSLSDQYWIKETDSPLEWRNINFFDNDFSDELGKVFLDPYAHVDSDNLNLQSPDITLQGNLLKAWKIVGSDKKRCLFKGDVSTASRVPHNEAVATRLYERVLNDSEFVSYWVVEGDHHAYSVCENMITSNKELISASQVLAFTGYNKKDSNYVAYVKSCKDFGIDDIEKALSKMLALDFVIANTDRHFNNFGLIRDINTLEYRIAPIFDNGNSLSHSYGWVRTSDFLGYKSKPFSAAPVDQLERYVTDLSWYAPDKVIGFSDVAKAEFAKSFYYKNFNEEVIEMICKGIDRRIEILNNRYRELAPVQIAVPALKKSR